MSLITHCLYSLKATRILNKDLFTLMRHEYLLIFRMRDSLVCTRAGNPRSSIKSTNETISGGTSRAEAILLWSKNIFSG